MLVRGWSWLHAKYTQTATKRLRVSETVSLGEKRFVSIVRVEDREFLIGGGASGVSLLAQLGAVPESAAATWPKNVQSIQGGRQ
jgi:flagellar biogenesis protein FliO